ncbi:MAG: hypothetical protein IKA78_02065 [Oscillospiraceae bacterium]|nr:hypothetical protein [Oscillospiraceae bacterium]
MTTAQKERLCELEARERLDDREFAEYEYLRKQAELQPRIEAFRKNQNAPYEEKLSRAGNLAWEFYNKMEGKCFVSVGGLDSITLYLFLRREGIDVPAVSVSTLEDKSIQRVHEALGIKKLKPIKSKIEVLREYGFPVISKEVANKVALLQNPSEKNATVRHAIITGETGAAGGYQKQSRMRLAQKWLDRFGGYENENEGVNYNRPDFLVSDKCCYFLKEKPCDDYAKQTGRHPYLGLMASEGGRREKALMRNGCNYYGKTMARSVPFATFVRNDILRLAIEMNEWYLQHTELFPGPPVSSTIPEI